MDVLGQEDIASIVDVRHSLISPAHYTIFAVLPCTIIHVRSRSFESSAIGL